MGIPALPEGPGSDEPGAPGLWAGVAGDKPFLRLGRTTKGDPPSRGFGAARSGGRRTEDRGPSTLRSSATEDGKSEVGERSGVRPEIGRVARSH